MIKINKGKRFQQAVDSVEDFLKKAKGKEQVRELSDKLPVGKCSGTETIERLWPTSCKVLIIGNAIPSDWMTFMADPLIHVEVNKLSSTLMLRLVLFVWLFREAQGRLERPTTSLFQTDRTADVYVSLLEKRDACPFCSVISADGRWAWSSNPTSDCGTAPLTAVLSVRCFASKVFHHARKGVPRGSERFGQVVIRMRNLYFQ